MDVKKEDLKAVLNILPRTTAIALLVLCGTKANIWVGVSTLTIADNDTDS